MLISNTDETLNDNFYVLLAYENVDKVAKI